ncbi:chain length determinant protein [uncultured Pontibacter sp.]|uniref:chain length determinant protein n=1 Tax=uncultured Pontibacter sp. TaxID=453356 RepID=UPI0026053026|nr:chain length determinant protein [uncultured Pontibacter sp.]
MYKERSDYDVPPTRSKSNDEIDLRDMLRWVKSIVKKTANGYSTLVQVTIRKKGLIAAFVIAGVILSLTAFYLTKPYYSSSMTLVLSEIRNDFVEDQLKKLASMVEDDNFEAVAESLDISVQSAEQIKKLDFWNLDEVQEDSILTGSPFRVELFLYDNKLFSSMEPAITDYLENNRYFAKQKRIKQKQMESMVGKLRSEILSIDSMKTSSISPRGPVNGFVYGEPLDPTTLFRESITMYQQQIKLEAELEQLDNIEVVTGFSPQSRPAAPSMVKYLAIGTIAAFLIGLIVAFNVEKSKKI